MCVDQVLILTHYVMHVKTLNLEDKKAARSDQIPFFFPLFSHFF